MCPCMFLALLVIINVKEVTAQSLTNKDVSCKEVQYVEMGLEAIISCEYDRSFYTVRWHFRSSTNAIVRIDNHVKSGTGITSGEFDIKDDGSLIIRKMKPSNQGLYSISVLNSDGWLSRANTTIIIIEPVKKIELYACNGIDDEICRIAQLTKDDAAVVCLTNEANPTANITWHTLNGRPVLSDLQPHNTISKVNDSVSFMTHSYRYDPSSFAFQYFTCVASGIAVKNISSASILVKGTKPYDDITETRTSQKKDDLLDLRCPRASYPFGTLNATFSNGSSSVIFDWNFPMQFQCRSNWECKITNNGLVEIIIPEDDISFTCISTSGDMTTKDVIHTRNHEISPRIDRCNNINEPCHRVTSSSDNVTCILPETKVKIELKFRLSDSDHSRSTITKQWSYNIRNHSSRTFDNFVTAEYSINQCIDFVLMECLPLQPEFNEYFDNVVIKLQPDESICQPAIGGSSAAVVVVIIVLGLAVIGGIGLFLIQRKGSLKKNRNRDPEKGHSQTADDENATKEEAEILLSKKIGVGENSSKEETAKTADDKNATKEEAEILLSKKISDENVTEGKTENLSLEQTPDIQNSTSDEYETLPSEEPSSLETKDAIKPDDPQQEYFDERFHPFLKKIYDGKAIDSEFERILIRFVSKYQKTDVKLILGQSVKNDNPSKEDLLAVIKFFANSSYVSQEGFHVLLLAAVKMTQLLPKDALAIVGEYFKTEKIDSKSFATITNCLINERNVRSSKVLKLLKKVSPERKHPEADAAEVLTHLFVLNVITSEMVTMQIQTDFSKSGDNIPFLFFMLVVEGEYSKTEHKGKLLQLLTTVTTTMKSKLDFGGNISSSDKEEINVTSSISKIIGLIVKENMLNVEDLMYILQSRCQASKITVALLITVLEDLLASEQMTLQQYVGQLKTGYVGHLIDQSTFLRLFSSLFNQYKIDGQKLLIELQQCKKENVIKEEEFVDFLLKLLTTKKLDFNKSILAFQDCKYQKLITEDSYITLMSSTLESEKMDTKLFINGIKCCREKNLITLEAFVNLLKNALNYQECDIQEYINGIGDCKHGDLITNETFVTLLSNALACQKVTEEKVTSLLLDALSGQEITQTSFFSLLTKALEHGKVSGERTQKLVLDNLQNDKLEKEALVKFTISIVNVQSIQETTLLDILQAIVNKFGIQKDELKALANDLQKESSLYKKVMKMKPVTS